MHGRTHTHTRASVSPFKTKQQKTDQSLFSLSLSSSRYFCGGGSSPLLNVQDLLGGAAAPQPVAAGPPADRRVPQRRQEDLHRHRLPDEPRHGKVQLGEAQRAALGGEEEEGEE